MLQDVKAACAAVGVNLETISLDQVMSATQDRHQSAAGQAFTTPVTPALQPTTEMQIALYLLPHAVT